MTLTDQLHPRVQLIHQDGTPTPFFHKFLVSLREKTGATGDTIQEIEIGELHEPGVETGYVVEVDENIEPYDFQPGIEVDEGDFHQQSQQIPVQSFTSVTKNINYTALPFEYVAMISDATIKLPAEPNDNDQVIVWNVNGKKIITHGNGKKINGDTQTISLRKNTTIVYQYFVDLDSWGMR